MAVYKYVILIFTNCFFKIDASYHWIVTESGKIQSQVENSGFPLAKHNDLLSFLEQEERINKVNKLYDELTSLKKSIDVQCSKIEKEGEFKNRLYSTDIDCLLGGMPLSQHNLNTEFMDYSQGLRPKIKENQQSFNPDCAKYSNLEFSMRIFPHLETMKNINNTDLTLHPVSLSKNFDFNVDALLKKNNTDWTNYNIASLYWRMIGNGSKALECAKRALFFSPLTERYIALLNLGSLLQELHSLGEAAIVLHSAVDHNPGQYISHLALGNVYAALGDYRRSIACYDNVLSLDPGNIRALQLKHALLCSQKLEYAFMEIHSSLQSILQDLQKHNKIHEEWLTTQIQLNWQRDSKLKEIHSLAQPIHLNLKMLLRNVEKQAKTLNKEVRRKAPLSALQESYNRQGKSTFNCNMYKCSHNNFEECQNEDKSKKFEESEESELENFISPEYVLKQKMNSVIHLIKSNFEEDAVNLKQNVIEAHNTKDNMNEQNLDTHFQVEKSMLFNNIDACVKNADAVKKLN